MYFNNIFYLNEKQYRFINEICFKNFIKDFKKETGIDTYHDAIKKGISKNNYTEQFFYLRYRIFTNYKEYINEFFNLLENYGYNMINEIIRSMCLIGETTFIKLEDSIKNYVLLCPFINDIENNNGKITIHSNLFGDYSFITTLNYLSNNPDALSLIIYYVTKQYCHIMSWDLIKCLENASLITYNLPYYFFGYYYHTIIKQDESIIDVANSFVIDEETRDRLFKGRLVVETPKEDLNKKLAEAKNYLHPEEDFNKPLIIALNKEREKYYYK